MGGVSMAVPRWLRDPFYQRVFRGRVLDIGGAGDPFAAFKARFPAVTEVVTADRDEGPAPALCVDLETWVPDPQTFDCVLSSHCLEHLTDPWAALDAWWEAVRPGGWLVVIVPSWRTYEREVWPSRYNTDHKTAWLLLGPYGPTIRGLADYRYLGPYLHRALTLDDGFIPGPADQTAEGTCESGLEAVWRKPA